MPYVYKNESDHSVNIAGYQFEAGQELFSNIAIERFSEAVEEGLLSLNSGSKDKTVKSTVEPVAVSVEVKPEPVATVKKNKSAKVKEPVHVSEAISMTNEDSKKDPTHDDPVAEIPPDEGM